MRRIWERRSEIIIGQSRPSNAGSERVAAAEREVLLHPDMRSATKTLLDLYAKAGDLDKAADLADRWSSRDPLDADALTARADLAARRGDRGLAIRILGGVVDVRPSDTGAQQRLARLYRWQGHDDLACSFLQALAECRPSDAKALADALRCLRNGDQSDLGVELLKEASETVAHSAEQILSGTLPEDKLSGDLQVTATWKGSDDVDVDISLIDPDAHRVSWLGAPTRAVISATTATSYLGEGLALRGAKPGEYVLEVSRGSGSGTVQGVVVVNIGGVQRHVPFVLSGERATLGIIKITMVPRLVPIADATPFRFVR
jgi:tetratricopeptide (TPR) repeat protein